MYFQSLADFIAMGTHGAYVWSAYGLTLFVVVVNLVIILRQRSKNLTLIQQKLRRQQLQEQETQ